MQIKLLNDVVGLIAGKTAVDIVNLLYGKKNVNEFLIAKKLSLTINQIRNILYKLSDSNLVSFSRKKDKRKGWYTYYWTLNLDKVYELLEKTIEKDLENLKAQLKSRQQKNFYVCKVCQVEVSEETALLHQFTCQECGEIYVLNTDKKIIKDLENKISRQEKELESVKIELREIDKQNYKKIEKEVKKAKAERKIQLKKRAKIRAKEKKKEEKTVKEKKKEEKTVKEKKKEEKTVKEKKIKKKKIKKLKKIKKKKKKRI